MAAFLEASKGLFDSEIYTLLTVLCKEGQEHLFGSWSEATDENKLKLATHLKKIDASTEGGLLEYIRRARKLLDESKRGVNPMEGCTPSVPVGETLDFGSDEFKALENQGLIEAGKSVYVLVAGGLGERLGYSGIKIALPCETIRCTSFLQLYIESILAVQSKVRKTEDPNCKLPFVIMTSDDTHSRTMEFLEEHKYFGMAKDQIHVLKQEKVACLCDSEARLSLEKGDPFAIETKPHGHGDIHSLIHSSGLLARWTTQGFKWLSIFQDTNALVFNGLLAALGVSAKQNFDMNSLTVPRKAKEAIGAITKLTMKDGSEMTCNVEYNQLDPLLRSTINPEGDVNDERGYSPFPGNVNQLVFKLDTYMEQLKKTGGLIAEFVNPKYKDATKTQFQKSTRLECMMQDYPKTLDSSAKVGFTSINQVWATYSPVKNAPASAAQKAAEGCPSHSATSAEAEMYESNCKKLIQIGVQIGDPETAAFNGIEISLYPRVFLSPSFGLTFDDLKARFPSPEKVHIKSGSVLIIDGEDITIEGLELEGAAIIKKSESAIIKDKKIKNQGWKLKAIEDTTDVAEELLIRGFTVDRIETDEI